MSGHETPALAPVRSLRFAGFALALLTIAAWWPALSAGFVSDDFIILQRLSDNAGLQNPAAYFNLRHFEYYRPLAFLDLAADWQLFGRNATGYHATAIALHVLNTLLVLLLSRRLMGLGGSVVAAALFAVHPSSHEAVVWVSSRFDLLATFWLLGGLLVLTWRHRAADTIAALAFLGGVLSKESSLALPVVAAAALALLYGERATRVLTQLAGFACAGFVYTFLRQGAGLAAMGGAARLPKLAALAGLFLFALAVARFGWARMVAPVRMRKRALEVALGAAVIVIGGVAWAGAPAIRGACDSIAFAAVHLLSPVAVDSMVGAMPPGSWAVGLIAQGLLLAMLVGWWTRLEQHPDVVFLIVFLLAALVPVSSMTEGTRYLYLATAPAAMLAGRLVDALAARRRPIAVAAAIAVLAVNVWQVQSKIGAWRWASEMTTRAATLMTGPGDVPCSDRHVVLLTAPVRVYGVYSNINLEALRWRGGCAPATFRTVVRLGLDNPTVAVTEHTPGRLSFEARNYRGGFVTSRDWRTFDVRLDGADPVSLPCPLGTFEAEPRGSDLLMRLSFAPGQPSDPISWFIFSGGAVRAVPASPRQP